jgi:nucleoside-diphosphate-sugar epimerase
MSIESVSVHILVLGGTSFVGRAIVAEALATGAEVTLFNRGRTGADLFPGVPRLTGDRTAGEYAALADGRWDAVVDVSGYLPRHVRQAADALGDRIGRYLFISTGSVYDRHAAAAGPLPEGGTTEDVPRLAPERDTEEINEKTYGPLKVACEDDVLDRYGERATVVRPGVVAGRYDPTDRFTWWVRRAARGGRVALPARPEQPVQVADSGDVARLVVRLVGQERTGIYNAVGPAEPTTLAGLVEECARAAGAEVEVVPVPPAWVSSWLPLVLPDPSWDVMFRRSPQRARAAGMTATPLAATAAEVLAWDRGRGEPPLAVEVPPEQEAELLARVDRDGAGAESVEAEG